MFKILRMLNPNGKKTYIAGYGLVILGLGRVLVVAGSFMTGQMELDVMYSEILPAWSELQIAFAGLGIVGIRHALKKGSK